MGENHITLRCRPHSHFTISSKDYHKKPSIQKRSLFQTNAVITLVRETNKHPPNNTDWAQHSPRSGNARATSSPARRLCNFCSQDIPTLPLIERRCRNRKPTRYLADLEPQHAASAPVSAHNQHFFKTLPKVTLSEQSTDLDS